MNTVMIFCEECEHLKKYIHECDGSDDYKCCASRNEVSSPQDFGNLLWLYRSKLKSCHPSEINKNNNCEWFKKK